MAGTAGDMLPSAGLDVEQTCPRWASLCLSHWGSVFPTDEQGVERPEAKAQLSICWTPQHADSTAVPPGGQLVSPLVPEATAELLVTH